MTTGVKLPRMWYAALVMPETALTARVNADPAASGLAQVPWSATYSTSSTIFLKSVS